MFDVACISRYCVLALSLLIPAQVMADGLTPSQDKAQRFPWLAHLPDGYLQLP